MSSWEARARAAALQRAAGGLRRPGQPRLSEPADCPDHVPAAAEGRAARGAPGLDAAPRGWCSSASAGAPTGWVAHRGAAGLRAGSAASWATDVDLGAVLAEVGEDLGGARTCVAHGRDAPGPCPGDPVQLRVVVQNLVANAAKSVQPGVAARSRCPRPGRLAGGGSRSPTTARHPRRPAQPGLRAAGPGRRDRPRLRDRPGHRSAGSSPRTAAGSGSPAPGWWATVWFELPG